MRQDYKQSKEEFEETEKVGDRGLSGPSGRHRVGRCGRVSGPAGATRDVCPHLKGCESTGWCLSCEVTCGCVGTGVKPTEERADGGCRQGSVGPAPASELRGEGVPRMGTSREKPQSMGLRREVANAMWL